MTKIPSLSPNPMPPTDTAVVLLTGAIALVRQWQFLARNPTTIMTPRQAADLSEERAEWLEAANEWSKNRPPAAASIQPLTQPCYQ